MSHHWLPRTLPALFLGVVLLMISAEAAPGPKVPRWRIVSPQPDRNGNVNLPHEGTFHLTILVYDPSGIKYVFVNSQKARLHRLNRSEIGRWRVSSRWVKAEVDLSLDVGSHRVVIELVNRRGAAFHQSCYFNVEGAEKQLQPGNQ